MTDRAWMNTKGSLGVLGRDRDGRAGRELSDRSPCAAGSVNVYARPTTSRFYLRHEGRYLQAFGLHHGLAGSCANPTWRIWHPFDDHDCWADEVYVALLDASDHFPVTLISILGKAHE